MSTARVGIVIALVAASGALGAGCGGGDNASSSSATPPTTTAATTTAATTTAATTTAAATGDVAAGKTFFDRTCQGCHLADGTKAGVGVVLAGGGRSAERIRNQVINGGGPMPGGLATGSDLDNVVTFVLSIQ